MNRHTVIGSLVRETLFEKEGQTGRTNRVSKVKLTAWVEAGLLVAAHFGQIAPETLKVLASVVALVLGIPGIRDAVPRTKPD